MLLDSFYGKSCDIAGIEVVKENHVLADQNHALAIVVGQMKSREIEATHKCRVLEESALFGLLESTQCDR